MQGLIPYSYIATKIRETHGMLSDEEVMELARSIAVIAMQMSGYAGADAILEIYEQGYDYGLECGRRQGQLQEQRYQSEIAASNELKE